MARVVFLTHSFPPETFAGANRAHALADELARGHSLRVVTFEPGYPDPTCFLPGAAAAFDSDAGFPIERAGRQWLNCRSFVRRAGRELRSSLSLIRLAVRHPADAVVATSPLMFLGPLGLVLARLKGAVFVWDVRDITWDVAGEMLAGSAVSRMPARLLRTVMWATARRVDLVVAATPGIASLAARAGVRPERLTTVENGISEARRAALRAIRTLPDNDRRVVTYIGLVGHAQDLGVLIDVALDMADVDFVVAGDGPQRLTLEARARSAGCRNVRFVGYVPPAALPTLIQGSDVMFAQVIETDTLNSTARPTKLLEYMAAGRPMVYAGAGDAADLVETIGCGMRASAGDPQGISRALRDLLADPGLRSDMARNGARHADRVRSREQAMTDFGRSLTARLPQT